MSDGFRTLQRRLKRSWHDAVVNEALELEGEWLGKSRLVAEGGGDLSFSVNSSGGAAVQLLSDEEEHSFEEIYQRNRGFFKQQRNPTERERQRQRERDS
jgi:hypothetical protein